MRVIRRQIAIFAIMKSEILKYSRILFAAASLAASSCSGNHPRYYQISGYAQGGTYSVKFSSEGLTKQPAEVRKAVDSILHLIDTTLSGYNKGSQLSRFNAGKPVEKNAMFKEMLSLSRKFYEETEGALDVASGPLFDAWGFGFTTDSLPSPEAVDSILAICGMKNLDENGEPLKEGIRPVLNFNAIAQGYTSDKIAGYLYSVGVKDMLVDIGEIFCDGVNQDGNPWSIGIDRPLDGNDDPGSDLDGIWQSDAGAHGVVTSGNYRKFYVKGGKKYSHTIDPRTGYPVIHSLLSATIVAPDAASADAYATYCMVIGLDEAKNFIQGRKDLEGYLIYDEEGTMREWASSGFKLAVE